VEFYYHGVDEDVLVLAADGGLNSGTAQQFIGDIEKLVDTGLRKILVDCEHLTYVSSYGLGVLLHLHHRLSKHAGNVKLCRVHGILVKVLETTHLDRVFHIYPDLDRAIVSFREHGLT
jgi:anti-sigma B factor antagonist